MANCNEAFHRLYEYLDRELSADEQQVVQRHLDRCPPCLHIFQFEENVLTFIGEKCRETAAPVELRERVRQLCEQQTSVTGGDGVFTEARKLQIE